MAARQEDAALRMLAFVASTTSELRRFSDRQDVDLVWPPDEPEPIPLASGGRLVLAINNLRVTADKTMQQEFPTLKPLELFKEYLATYRRERKASDSAERDLGDLASELSSQISETSERVVDALKAVGTAKSGLDQLLLTSLPRKFVISILSDVDEKIRSASSSLAMARAELLVGIAAMRFLKSAVTWVVSWIPWTLNKILWIVLPWRELGLELPWIGTTWKSKSVRYWVSAMNQLIATSEPYFDSNSLKEATGIVDRLLPVYRASVLASKEKLDALRALTELTIMLTVQSEKEKVEADELLRQASRMMRVLYVALSEYAKLGVEASVEIDSLMHDVAAHTLTILYFLTFEKVSNAVMKEDFSGYDAMDMKWFDSVYLRMDWFEAAEELGPIEYSSLVAAAQEARDGTRWSDAVVAAEAPPATAPEPTATTTSVEKAQLLLPPIENTREAYMLAPREPHFKRLEVANNVRGDKWGIGAVIQASITTRAITDGDSLVESIQSAYSNLVSATETINLTLLDPKTAQPSRRVRKLRGAVRNAVVVTDGELKLEELHPKGEDATEVELVELMGELRTTGMNDSSTHLSSARRRHTVMQAKLDVASANVVGALESVQTARQTLSEIAKSRTGREYAAGLGEIDGALADSVRAIEEVREELNPGQVNSARFEELLSLQIESTARVTGRRPAVKKKRIREEVTPEDIETEWLDAFGKVSNHPTRTNVSTLAGSHLWDEGGFGALAPLTIRSQDALEALETLQHIAQRRAADTRATGWLTEDPAQVAQMLDSIARAMRIFAELPKRDSFAKGKAVGGTINAAIESALGIEYQAAWEYANQQKVATQPQHLYDETRRQQLLLSQNWFEVGHLAPERAGYLEEFRQVARNAYP